MRGARRRSPLAVMPRGCQCDDAQRAARGAAGREPALQVDALDHADRDARMRGVAAAPAPPHPVCAASDSAGANDRQPPTAAARPSTESAASSSRAAMALERPYRRRRGCAATASRPRRSCRSSCRPARARGRRSLRASVATVASQRRRCEHELKARAPCPEERLARHHRARLRCDNESSSPSRRSPSTIAYHQPHRQSDTASGRGRRRERTPTIQR